MDDARTELITALCAQAGMMMEDASELAVTMPGQDKHGIGETLARLQAELSATATLIAAAQALHRRG